MAWTAPGHLGTSRGQCSPAQQPSLGPRRPPPSCGGRRPPGLRAFLSLWPPCSPLPPPPQQPASLDAQKAGESTLASALPLTSCATGSKCLSLSETHFLSCETAAVIPASGAAVRTKGKPERTVAVTDWMHSSLTPPGLCLGCSPHPCPPPQPGILSSSQPAPPLGEVLQGPPFPIILQAPCRASHSLLEKL